MMKIEEKIEQLYIEHLTKFKEEPTIILMNEKTENKIIDNFKYIFNADSHEINRPFYWRGIKIHKTPYLDDFEVLVK